MPLGLNFNPADPQFLAKVQAAAQDAEYLGFCLSCGHEHDRCEPDARRRQCDNCESLMVYGAEEILMMML